MQILMKQEYTCAIINRNTAVLVVADRSNQRLQRFTLEGKHIDFILGTSKLPCHFHERNGEVVIPDLWSKVVVLDRDNKLVAALGTPGTFL
jgi:hypothetical protein